MRILLKILLFPIIVALTIIVAFGRFLYTVSGAILGVIAFVFFLIAICTVLLLQQPIRTGLEIAVIAWVISPFGLPIIVTFLVELLGAVKDSLKAI